MDKIDELWDDYLVAINGFGKPGIARAALHAEFERLQQERSGICNWTYEDNNNYWQTDCGDEFVLEDGTPKDNGMRFCVYCGKPLAEVIPPEDPENA